MTSRLAWFQWCGNHSASAGFRFIKSGELAWLSCTRARGSQSLRRDPASAPSAASTTRGQLHAQPARDPRCVPRSDAAGMRRQGNYTRCSRSNVGCLPGPSGRSEWTSCGGRGGRGCVRGKLVALPYRQGYDTHPFARFLNIAQVSHEMSQDNHLGIRSCFHSVRKQFRCCYRHEC